MNQPPNQSLDHSIILERAVIAPAIGYRRRQDKSLKKFRPDSDVAWVADPFIPTPVSSDEPLGPIKLELEISRRGNLVLKISGIDQKFEDSEVRIALNTGEDRKLRELTLLASESWVDITNVPAGEHCTISARCISQRAAGFNEIAVTDDSWEFGGIQPVDASDVRQSSEEIRFISPVTRSLRVFQLLPDSDSLT